MISAKKKVSRYYKTAMTYSKDILDREKTG